MVLPGSPERPNGVFRIGHPPRKAIILIRSPYEAILALRHFHSAGHTGFAPYAAFQGTGRIFNNLNFITMNKN